MADRPFTALADFYETIQRAREEALSKLKEVVAQLPGQTVRIALSDAPEGEWGWTLRIKTARVVLDGDGEPRILIRSGSEDYYLSANMRLAVAED